MQSNKDSRGGKSHPTEHRTANKQGGKSSEKQPAANSPIGPMKTGEKKTTPH